MRKRTVIAIIITILILVGTNKSWLEYKPMSVDLDIMGKGKCSIEAQLNKKNNNEFEKIKTQVKKVNLDKTSHVKFSVQRSKYPKRIRFVFNNLAADNPIVIKNITLKNGKYRLNDLKEFSVSAGTLAVNTNTMQITPPPSGNCVILTYNKPLKVRASIKFDFKLFIVILVLTYLLAFKLTDYAANFNTIKHQSHIEIIFLLIFFIFLYIPMSHMSTAKYSKNENRPLFEYKPLLKHNGELNLNFGRDYTNWFNDRFFLRQFLLDTQVKMLLPITDIMPKGVVDKDGLLFADYELKYDLEKINNADYKALIKFDKYCKDHNIEFYVLLVPVKKYIYPPSRQILVNDKYADDIDTKVKELNEKYGMHIINPLKEMREDTKNHYIFFKSDHHWTFDGAYLGYLELMKEINKKHKDIYVLQEKDFNFYYSNLVNSSFMKKFEYGYCSIRMNLSEKYIKKIHNKKYRYFAHKKSNTLKTEINIIPYHFNKKYYFPDGADYRVLVLGASMIENLDEFMPYTFKNVFHMRINNIPKVSHSDVYKIIKLHEKEILDYKPDIIVLCAGYGELYRFRDFFKR